MLKVGWFSTARGESSRKLLKSVYDSIQSGVLKANIEFVFCSRELSEAPNTDLFLAQVKEYNLPLVSLSIKKYAEKYQKPIGVSDEKLPDWRLAYDHQAVKLLQKYKVDICVLAGYMLIVSTEMCHKYNMINLHPALPAGPKGTWQEVIWTLINEKARVSGVMMHLVTPELDRGPVITYCSYPITGPEFEECWKEIELNDLGQIKSKQGENNRLFSKIRQAGFIREIPLIIHTLKSFSESSIRINENQLLLDEQGQPIPGYDLTQEINRSIAVD